MAKNAHRKKVSTIFLFMCFLSFCSVSIYAEVAFYPIDSSKSQIMFKAKSTLHPIYGKAKKFKGILKAESGSFVPVINGNVEVEVEGLVSGNKALDRNMYRMFHAKLYPKIYCQIDVLEFTAADLSSQQDGKLRAVLKIKDIQRSFECPVQIIPMGDGFIVRGFTVVSLKEFTLRPPTVLGIIRVQDEVTINFDVMFARNNT